MSPSTGICASPPAPSPTTPRPTDGPCAALVELATRADLFLCEADIDGHREGERIHLTPEDAGRIAREAHVRELLITHVGPTLNRESATARAAVAFGRPTDTAREGDSRIV